MSRVYCLATFSCGGVAMFHRQGRDDGVHSFDALAAAVKMATLYSEPTHLRGPEGGAVKCMLDATSVVQDSVTKVEAVFHATGSAYFNLPLSVHKQVAPLLVTLCTTGSPFLGCRTPPPDLYSGNHLLRPDVPAIVTNSAHLRASNPAATGTDALFYNTAVDFFSLFNAHDPVVASQLRAFDAFVRDDRARGIGPAQYSRWDLRHGFVIYHTQHETATASIDPLVIALSRDPLLPVLVSRPSGDHDSLQDRVSGIQEAFCDALSGAGMNAPAGTMPTNLLARQHLRLSHFFGPRGEHLDLPAAALPCQFSDSVLCGGVDRLAHADDLAHTEVPVCECTHTDTSTLLHDRSDWVFASGISPLAWCTLTSFSSTPQEDDTRMRDDDDAPYFPQSSRALKHIMCFVHVNGARLQVDVKNDTRAPGTHPEYGNRGQTHQTPGIWGLHVSDTNKHMLGTTTDYWKNIRDVLGSTTTTAACHRNLSNESIYRVELQAVPQPCGDDDTTLALTCVIDHYNYFTAEEETARWRSVIGASMLMQANPACLGTAYGGDVFVNDDLNMIGIVTRYVNGMGLHSEWDEQPFFQRDCLIGRQSLAVDVVGLIDFLTDLGSEDVIGCLPANFLDVAVSVTHESTDRFLLDAVRAIVAVNSGEECIGAACGDLTVCQFVLDVLCKCMVAVSQTTALSASIQRRFSSDSSVMRNVLAGGTFEGGLMSHADAEFVYLFGNIVADDWTSSLSLNDVRTFLHSRNSLHGLYRRAGRRHDAMTVPPIHIMSSIGMLSDISFAHAANALPSMLASTSSHLAGAYTVHHIAGDLDAPAITVSPEMIMGNVDTDQLVRTGILGNTISSLTHLSETHEMGPAPLDFLSVRVKRQGAVNTDAKAYDSDSDGDFDEERVRLAYTHRGPLQIELSLGNGVACSLVASLFSHLTTYFGGMKGLCHSPTDTETPFMLLQDVVCTGLGRTHAPLVIDINVFTALLTLGVLSHAVGATPYMPISPAELEGIRMVRSRMAAPRFGTASAAATPTLVSPDDRALRVAVHAHALRAFPTVASGSPGSIPRTFVSSNMGPFVINGDANRAVCSSLLAKMGLHTPASGKRSWDRVGDGTIRKHAASLPYDACQPFATACIRIPPSFDALPTYALLKHAFFSRGVQEDGSCLAKRLFEHLKFRITYVHDTQSDDKDTSVSLAPASSAEWDAMSSAMFDADVDTSSPVVSFKRDDDGDNVSVEISYRGAPLGISYICDGADEKQRFYENAQNASSTWLILRQVFCIEAIRNFICSASDDMLVKFIHFCTGNSYIGVGEDITVSMVPCFAIEALPFAATCSAFIQIPIYAPMDIEPATWDTFQATVSAKFALAITQGVMTHA